MKITIEPTNPTGYPGTIQQAVTVAVPNDQLNLNETCELLTAALLAYGFRLARLEYVKEGEE